MEAQEEMNYKSGEHQPLDISFKSHGFEFLLCVFEWLVPHLKMLTTVSHQESSEIQGFLSEKHKATLTGLLRRCLLICSPENKQLMGSVLVFAHLIGNPSLLRKLEKLSSLGLSDLAPNSDPPGDVIPLSQQKDILLLAQENFELMTRYRVECKEAIRPKEFDLRPKSSRWKVVKSWKPCGIGNIPSTTGFSVHLSSLDCTTDECTEVVKLSDSKECSKLKHRNKRKATVAIQDIKKLKETKPDCESYDTGHHFSSQGVIIGHLMIDGIWKEVGQEEFLAIASAVRLLV